MPNYVTNILQINGEENEVKRCLQNIKSDDGVGFIDFNKIKPMPESLNLTSGTTTRDAICYAWLKKDKAEQEQIINILENLKNAVSYENDLYLTDLKNPNLQNDIQRLEEYVKQYIPSNFERELNINSFEELGNTYINNIKEYGFATWYDWCRENWGTKWNACASYVVSSNSISFDTAWSTPLEVIQELSILYPKLEFEVSYADEDYGYNVGEYAYKNGEIIRGLVPDEGSIEAMKMAEAVLGFGLYEEETDKEMDDI